MRFRSFCSALMVSLLLAATSTATASAVQAGDAVSPAWMAEGSLAFDAMGPVLDGGPLDPQEFAAAIAQFEQDERERLSSPQAISERESSVDRFESLGAAAAEDLLLDTFPDPLATLVESPADPVLSAEEVVSFHSDTVAVIDPAGPIDRSMVTSTMPLRTEDERIVDTDLVPAEGGFAPKVPLTEVKLPGQAGGSFDLPSAGLSVSFPDARSESDGSLVEADALSGKDAAFYPNTQVDTDTLALATSQGFETFTQLRSADSPEEIRVAVAVAEGDKLTATQDGGAIVTNGDGESKVTIPPPFAFDAQGQNVPVSMVVEEGGLVISAPHRGEDFAYPILVDPEFLSEGHYWWSNGASDGYQGWGSAQSGTSNYQLGQTCPSAIAALYPCGGSGTAGLYVSAKPGYTYPAGSKGWWTWTPVGTTNYIKEVRPNWIYRQGAATPTHPYAFYTVTPAGTGLNVTTGGQGTTQRLYGDSATSRYFNTGLYTANAQTMPAGNANWRYNRLAAFTAETVDPNVPTGFSLNTSGAPTGWIPGGTTFTVKGSASDNGTGIYVFWSEILGQSGRLGKGFGWCLGDNRLPCSATVTNRDLTFDTDNMLSGINQVSVYPADAQDNPSTVAKKNALKKTFQVKVDNTPTRVVTTGSALDTENPGANLRIVATDGDIIIRNSGVKSIEVKVEGESVYEETFDCTQLMGSCPQRVTRDVQLPVSELIGEDREIEVLVKDQVGNEGVTPTSDAPAWTRSFEPEIFEDGPGSSGASGSSGGATASSYPDCSETGKDISQAKHRPNVVKPKNGKITGGACADIIIAGDNVTTIDGKGGDDIIIANNNDQVVHGGKGDDVIFTGRNNDEIHGDEGNDTLYGEMGDDYLYGGDGDDTLYGGHGTDALFGNGRNDTLDGGHGSDRIIGGAGDFDVLSYASAIPPGFEKKTNTGGAAGVASFASESRGVNVDFTAMYNGEHADSATDGKPRLGGGKDWLCDNQDADGNKFKYCQSGLDEIELVLGSSFDDVITLRSHQKAAIGGAGADLIDGAGSASIYGGYGSDLLKGGPNVNMDGGPGLFYTDSCIHSGGSGTGSEARCEEDDNVVRSHVRDGKIFVGTLQDRGSIGSGLPEPDGGLPVFNDAVSLYLNGSQLSDNVKISYDVTGSKVTFEVGQVPDGFGNAGRFFPPDDPACSIPNDMKVICDLGGKPLASLVVSGARGNDSFALSGFGFKYNSTNRYQFLRAEGSVPEVLMTGGSGRDYLVGDNGDDFLVDGDNQGADGQGEYREKLVGGNGNDLIIENRGADRIESGNGDDLIMSTAVCNSDQIIAGKGLDNSQWAQLPRGENVSGSKKAIRSIGVYLNLTTGKIGRSYQNPENNEIKGKSCSGVVSGIDRIEASNNSDKLVGENGQHPYPNKFLARSGRDWVKGGFGTVPGETNVNILSAKDGGEPYNKDLYLHCGTKGTLVRDPGVDPSNGNCSESSKNKYKEARYGGDPSGYYTETLNAVEAGGQAMSAGPELVDDSPPALDGTNRFESDWDVDRPAVTPVALYSLAETSGDTAVSQIEPEADGTYLPDPDVDGPELGVEGVLGAGTGDGAAALDGEDDMIGLTEEFEPAEIIEEQEEPDAGYAVEVWAKLGEGEPADPEPLFSREGTYGGIKFFRDTDGSIVLESDTGEQVAKASTFDPVVDGEWHQFAFSMEDKELTVWVDGFPTTTGFDFQVTPAETPNAENVAGAAPESDEFSEVEIDDVAIYDQPLETRDLLAHLAVSDVEASPYALPSTTQIDSDSDGVDDDVDNCPATANANQEDPNEDGVGDACAVPADDDGDGITDDVDNCVEWANPEQEDVDENDIGDICEAAPDAGAESGHEGDTTEVEEVDEEP